MVVVISHREEMQEVRKPPVLLWLVSGQSDSSSRVHTFSLGLPGHSWRYSELSPVLHSGIILGGIRGPSECTMALTQDSILPVLWAELFPFPPTGVSLYLHQTLAFFLISLSLCITIPQSCTERHLYNEVQKNMPRFSDSTKYWMCFFHYLCRGSSQAGGI